MAKLLISAKNQGQSNELMLRIDADKSLQEKLLPLPYTDIGNGADIGKSFSIIFSTVISFIIDLFPESSRHASRATLL